MLCRSIAEKGFEKIATLIEGAEMAEIRIEKSGLTSKEITRLFRLHSNLIATCRAENLSDEERIVLMKAAISGGAKWIDIEIESQESYLLELTNYAKKYDCKIIISYHNYRETPDNSELSLIIIKSLEMGANLIKIASQVSNNKDTARLLALYQYEVPLLVLGMGELGKITRISALKLGAPFTFVSCNDTEVTAPGQLSENDMNAILNSF